MSNQIGVFITKENKDVTKPQNIQDYILNSNYNTLKIYKRINSTVSVPLNSWGDTSVTHGLQYHPAFLSYYRLKNSSHTWWMDQTSLNTQISNHDGFRCGTTINPERIKFEVYDGEGNGPSIIECKGTLLVDPIHLVPDNIVGIPLTPGAGFKVSKPKVDVIKAKAHELIISSKYEGLKFHMEKQISVSFSDTDTYKETTFQHGLNYVPMFLATVTDYNDPTKQRLIPFGRVPQPYATSIGADKEVIRIGTVFISGLAFTDTYRIIVLKNKLSDD